MIAQDLETRIIDLLSMILQLPPEIIQDDASMQTISTWDSLRHMSLIAVLEDEFDVEIKVSQFSRMTSLAGLLKEMRSVLNEKLH